MSYLWRVCENLEYSTESLRCHTYVKGCAHTQRHDKAPVFLTLSSIKALQKQKVKVRKNCKLPDCPTHTQNPLAIIGSLAQGS